MATLAELKKTRVGVAEKLAAYKAKPTDQWTDEDLSAFDALEVELSAVDTEIKAAEDRAKQIADRQKRAGVEGEKLAAHQPRRADPNGPANLGTEPAKPRDEKERPFRTLGQQMLAIAAAEGKNPSDEVINRLAAVYDLAPSGMAAANPADGGFLIQQDFIAEIMKRTYETGQIASRVKRIGVGPNSNGIKFPAVGETSRANGSRWGGVQTYWGNEGVAPTAKKPSIRQVEINLGRLTGLMYATDDLLNDATAMESYANMAFQEEFQFVTEDVILNGDGAGKPKGVNNSNSLVTVTKETGQAGGTIVMENIQKMWSRMWAPSRANAVWLINQDCEPALDSMQMTIGTGGVPVYLPPSGISESPYSRLKGRPVIPVEYCSTLGTVGDIMLVDLSQYILIEKGGVETASSMHVNFTTAEMAYRFIYRVGGQTWWSSALTPKNGSNTLSPFIVLATRS